MAAHQRCKGVAVAVDFDFMHASTLIVVIEHSIASDLNRLLTEAITEQIIVGCFVFSVF